MLDGSQVKIPMRHKDIRKIEYHKKEEDEGFLPASSISRMDKITVLGAGSWGTALAVVAASSGHRVLLWCRDEGQADVMRRTGTNTRYLPDTRLPEEIGVTSSLLEAVEFSEHWITAIPTQGVRDLLRKIGKTDRGDGISLCNVAKGIEVETLARISDIVKDELPGARYSVLSGPSHAEEVVKGLPTAVVVASESPDQPLLWQEALSRPYFRIYSSLDVCGVEIGGAVKNVVAIASGLAHSMGMGDNATAAMVTRGLAEITRLAIAMGAHPITLAGLAGIGDLMVTAYSHHSRNFRLGIALGEGKSLDMAVKSLGQVAEGIYTVKAAVSLGRTLGVELPITEAVNQILYCGTSPQKALTDLLSRDTKPEYPPQVFRQVES